MKISVIICTHNRYQRLAKTLNSLVDMALPQSIEWDAIVVDNNSSDNTREVVQGDFCSRYPGRFHYIFEPRPGKSYALNTAVQQAQGDILVFTDDDVVAEKNWLQNLTSGLHDSEWAGAGGRVLGEWECPPPRWLALKGRYSLGDTLALFDRGSEAHELSENPFGANMAYRKAMFEKYGGFRTDLGPRAGSQDPQKSEDAEFGRRLLNAGERLRYEPAAVVHHWVPENRLKKDYFLDWWFDKGRSDVRRLGGRVDGRSHERVLLPVLRRLISSTLRWMISTQPPRRFYNKVRVWELAGQFIETYRLTLRLRKTKKIWKSSENTTL